MKSRFFSYFSIFILLVMLAPAGCYPHGGGRSAGDDARRLLQQARAACERGDPGAFEMLWGRLAAADPQVARGEEAQELDARCRQDLQSAPRIGEPDADSKIAPQDELPAQEAPAGESAGEPKHPQHYNKRESPSDS